MPWYLMLDFFGFLNCLGAQSYNVTWWFYSCIIMLYIFFPLFRRLLIYDRNYFYVLLYISIFLSISYIDIGVFAPIRVYLFPFLIGMECSVSNKKKYRCKLSLILGVLLSLIILRFVVSRLGAAIDVFITFYLISSYKMISNVMPLTLKNIVEYVGKHSFNIFLFHTFIFYYYFKSFIYSFYSPVIIFVVLLVICLALSACMEKLKKISRFYELQNYILDKI
jgi:peptidoglycan/LPS O-acetylase OafA/YrhL